MSQNLKDNSVLHLGPGETAPDQMSTVVESAAADESTETSNPQQAEITKMLVGIPGLAAGYTATTGANPLFQVIVSWLVNLVRGTAQSFLGLQARLSTLMDALEDENFSDFTEVEEVFQTAGETLEADVRLAVTADIKEEIALRQRAKELVAKLKQAKTVLADFLLSRLGDSEMEVKVVHPAIRWLIWGFITILVNVGDYWLGFYLFKEDTNSTIASIITVSSVLILSFASKFWADGERLRLSFEDAQKRIWRNYAHDVDGDGNIIAFYDENNRKIIPAILDSMAGRMERGGRNAFVFFATVLILLRGGLSLSKTPPDYTGLVGVVVIVFFLYMYRYIEFAYFAPELTARDEQKYVSLENEKNTLEAESKELAQGDEEAEEENEAQPLTRSERAQAAFRRYLATCTRKMNEATEPIREFTDLRTQYREGRETARRLWMDLKPAYRTLADALIAQLRQNNAPRLPAFDPAGMVTVDSLYVPFDQTGIEDSGFALRLRNFTMPSTDRLSPPYDDQAFDTLLRDTRAELEPILDPPEAETEPEAAAVIATAPVLPTYTPPVWPLN
jgi:hypothetical protein